MTSLARRLTSCAVIVSMVASLATPAWAQDAGIPYFRFNPGGSSVLQNPLPPGQDTNTVPGDGDLRLFGPVQVRGRPEVGFSLKFTALNPTGVVNWASIGAALPPGLSMDRDGRLHGVPSAVGTYDGIKVQGVDASGKIGTTKPFKINVEPLPTVTVTEFTEGQAGKAMTITPSASGTWGSVSWELVDEPGSTPLPVGLKPPGKEGVMAGKPEQKGEFAGIRVKVKDSDGAVGVSNPFTVKINSNLTISGLSAIYPARVGRGMPRIQPYVTGASRNVLWGFSENGAPQPSWLGLAPTAGTMSGTPPETGTFPGVVVRVQDTESGEAVSSAPITFKVGGLPTVTMKPSYVLRPKAQGEKVSITPVVKDLMKGGRWSQTGVLPGGLVQDKATGEISGTITSPGVSSNLTVTVTDMFDGEKGTSAPFSVQVAPALAMSPPVVAQAEVGKDFTVGKPPLAGLIGAAAWSLAGKLPDGLGFDPATATISGKPTTSGEKAELTLKVVDSFDGAEATQDFSIEVLEEAEFKVADLSSPYPAKVGEDFTLAPTAQGNKAPLTWQLRGEIPGWLAIDPTSGKLSGKPDMEGAIGPLSFTATEAGTNRTADSNEFVIEVEPVGPLSLDVADATIELAKPYAGGAPKVENAVGKKSFALYGALPDGLAFNEATGVISGTPSVGGTFGDLQMSVTDEAGQAAYDSFSITVEGEAAATMADIEAAQGEEFSGSPTQEGMVGAVAWELDGGALPAWARLDPATGTISGNGPEVTVVDGLVLKATDELGNAARTDPFSIAIVETPALKASIASLLKGTTGKPFTAAAAAQGVQGTASWSLKGTRPPGINLGAGTGAFSGTPTTPGIFPGLVLTVTDSKTGASADTDPFTIEIEAGELKITGVQDFQATLREPFTAGIGVEGAVAPVRWRIVEGGLPLWARHDTASGAIAGTPDEIGVTSGLKLQVTDASGATAFSGAFSITVKRPELKATGPAGTVKAPAGVAYSVSPKAEGLVGAPTWSIAGNVPPGLHLDPVTGALSGTPTTDGLYAGLSFTVRDAFDGAQATTAPFAIQVGPDEVEEKEFTARAAQPEYNHRLGAPFTTGPAVAENASGTVTWSLKAGVLPAWASFSPETGAISGNPDRVTTYAGFVLTGRDGKGRLADTPPFSIKTTHELRITGVPEAWIARVGKNFASPLPGIVGQLGTAEWALAGSVPAWATFNTLTGSLQGRPTALGSYKGLTLGLTDRPSGATAKSDPVDLEVLDELGVANLPTEFTARFGHPFESVEPVLVNAYGAAKWAWAPGSAPPSWVKLDPATGVMTGTPNSLAGASDLQMLASDASGDSTRSIPFTIRVFNKPEVVVATSEFRKRVGDAFSLKPTVAGVVGTPSWSLETVSGSLPSGVAINAATGEVAGRLDEEAVGTFVIRVTDSRDGASAISEQVSLAVRPRMEIAGLAPSYVVRKDDFMTTDQPMVLGAQDEVAFSLSLAPPAGMAFDTATGILSGIPYDTMPSGTVTLTATDKWDNATATTSYVLNVVGELVASLPEGAEAVRTRGDIASAAPTPSAANLMNPDSVTWSKGSGTFPAGVEVDPSTGRLIGTAVAYSMPTTFAGLTLVATDTIDGATAETAPFSVTVYPDLSLTMASTSYTSRLNQTTTIPAPTVANAMGSLSWELVTQSAGLPVKWAAGESQTMSDAAPMSVSGTPPAFRVGHNGSVSFTPTAENVGTWVFTLQARDVDGMSVRTPPVSVDIAGEPLALTGIPGDVMVFVDQSMTWTGTLANLKGQSSFALEGSLPKGLAFAASTDGTFTISGAAESGAASATVKVTASDSLDGASVSQTIRFTVAPPLKLSYWTAAPKWRVARPVSMTANATGTRGPGTVTYTATGTLPNGVTLDPATGEIRGEPTTPGAGQPVTVTVSDAETGGKASFTLTPAVAENLVIAAEASYKAKVGMPFTLAMTGTGLQQASPYWTFTGLPAGMSGTTGGVISTTPTLAQVGTHTVTVSLTDVWDSLTVRETFELVVAPAPILAMDASITLQPQTLPAPGACTPVAVRNTGSATAVSLRLVLPEDGTDLASCEPAAAPVCGSSLAAGASCSFGVQLESETAGSKSGTIKVAADDVEASAPYTGLVVTDGLFAFTSHTFTNCGMTGHSGPSLTLCRSAYTTDWENDTSLFNVLTGMQLWTVPRTGTYRIEAAGASAGLATGKRAGRGAVVAADFTLNKGDKLLMLVGQQGTLASGATAAGGGGGTFVTLGTDKATSVPLIVAGGGGGASATAAAFTDDSQDASYGINGQNSMVLGTNYSTGGTSGLGASGGGGYGSPGGGFRTSGTPPTGSTNGAGQGFKQGGLGGNSSTAPTGCRGSGLGSSGGFGGGGGSCVGGGGGYSGGAPGFFRSVSGSTGQTAGGGGGSYVDATGANRTNLPLRSGHGYVTITAVE